MTRRDRSENVNREGDIPASNTGSEEQPRRDFKDIPGAPGAAMPDMNQDPLAGAMDQASAQTDTLEHAVADDTGVAAGHEPAGAGGPASRNTSAPAGEEIGRDEPTEGEPDD